MISLCNLTFRFEPGGDYTTDTLKPVAARGPMNGSFCVSKRGTEGQQPRRVSECLLYNCRSVLIFSFKCHHILHMVGVREHVDRADCGDFVVTAEDFEVTGL